MAQQYCTTGIPCELCYIWHLTTVVKGQQTQGKGHGQLYTYITVVAIAKTFFGKSFFGPAIGCGEQVQSSQPAVGWSQAFVEVMVVCFGSGLTVNIALVDQGDQLFVHTQAAVQTHMM